MKICAQAVAQATGFGLALASPGFGSGLAFSKPEPDEAKPKPWLPGQAKPRKGDVMRCLKKEVAEGRKCSVERAKKILRGRRAGEHRGWRVK
jgi:hypothetical protein